MFVMNTKKNTKKEIDMLHGSMTKGILLFALPLAATGILQQLFNAADVAIVGQFVKNGKNAMAAVGANSPVINLIVNLFVGISIGTNVIIANSIGRKDIRKIHKAIYTSLLLSVIGGAAVTLIGELSAKTILAYMNVPEEIFPLALRYLRIYLAGMIVILLYNFEAAIFRGAGDSRTPLFALTFSGIINVILNLFFVIGIGMNVDGVALATVIANLFSASLLFFKLLRSDSEIRIRKEEIDIDAKVLGSILKIGVPSGVQSGIFSLANIVIQTAINGLGATVMAASSAAYNIEIFIYYVINSFGQTCTTFVGQNFGAGNARRCKRSLLVCLLLDIAVTTSLVTLVLLNGTTLLSIFNSEKEVLQTGYIRLEYIFSSYLFTLPQVIMSGYLCGFGKSLPPAVIAIFGVCATRLFWIFFVFPHHRTFANIMTAYPVSMSVTAVSVLIALLILRPSRSIPQKSSQKEKND